MKSIAYAMVASTALVMGSMAPEIGGRAFACAVFGVAFTLLMMRKD